METFQNAGYREIEHTADWELQVWAPDLASLLVQAAEGMYALSKTLLAEEPRLWQSFTLPNPDPESLLVDFLSELLFLGETQGVGFDTFLIEIEGQACYCRVGGAPITSQGKEIKAVTFHQMEVQRTAQGLSVHIVFDV